ncbi:hypothetical protein CN971_07905 [Bacillus thuringiensis]|uniref:Uncharacterized protein n=2 Tax=Bacillus thuringiensis TaxID=1428 RepID=A0A9X7BRL2_BACTU|nr:ABC transporter permease protein [Bacillus thuringiensis YBT-1518]EKS8362027.1 hypothetical protein [Bacillus cereus]MBG9484893.1 hypothetical protein [Bacillus thuringiensis]EKS8368425.1 hypothetical protein [Bacillus cereus]MBG9495095.1 hypothetical protein [Bacillus thuringiensis]
MIKQLILKDFIIQWKFLIWYILYPVFFYMGLTDTENLFIILLFIGSICMFIASIFVSVKIYEKREF